MVIGIGGSRHSAPALGGATLGSVCPRWSSPVWANNPVDPGSVIPAGPRSAAAIRRRRGAKA